MLDIELVKTNVSDLFDRGDKAGAMEFVLSMLGRCPDNRELMDIAENIRCKRIKIAFFCGLDGVSFLWDIGMFAKSQYVVRFFEGGSEKEMQELMEWSDVSWFEWCTDLAARGSRLPKVCNNIIRLHRYEAFTDWPRHVNWDNVDTLITLGNDYVRDRLERVVPGLGNKVHISEIANGVNLNKFKYKHRVRGKNLAYIGSLNMKKNPAYLLHNFKRLLEMDDEYRLFFAGKYQDVVLEQYMNYMIGELGIEDKVVFDGWCDDINEWLADKHYVINSSIVEGHPVGIMEAMSCGLKPVMHNFPGAKQFFPEEYLYNGPEEFCRMIVDGDYEPWKYRAYIEDHYPLRNQLMSINRLFVDVEKGLDAQTGVFGVQSAFQPCNSVIV